MEKKDFELICLGIEQVFLGEDRNVYYFSELNCKRPRGLCYDRYVKLHTEAIALGFINEPIPEQAPDVAGIERKNLTWLSGAVNNLMQTLKMSFL